MRKKKVSPTESQAFSKFAFESLPVWLQGSDDFTYLSTVCLRRNLKGRIFPHKMTSDEKAALAREVHRAVCKTDFHKVATYACLKEIDNHRKCLTFERKWCDAFYTGNSNEETLFIYTSQDERVRVVVNNDDHIEIRVSNSNGDSLDCYKRALAISEELGLEYCKMEPFGYLTACPSLMGAAINVEHVMHVPLILVGDARPDWIGEIEKENFVIGGFFGMGSPIMGNLITISNKNTHRLSAEQLLHNNNVVVERIAEMEQQSRKEMDANEIKDIVARAYGTLKHAVKIEFGEALTGIGYIKLGMEIGLIKSIALDEWKKAMRDIFPFHLQAVCPHPKDEEDFVRGKMLHDFLAKRKEKNV